MLMMGDKLRNLSYSNYHESILKLCIGKVKADGVRIPGAAAADRIVPNPKLKLLDQVREVMRLKHYSLHTERCYCDWIRRYVHFHEMRTWAELAGGEAKIEQFLSDLAVRGQVAAATQNQAFNALLFLYRQVLRQALGTIQALRADRPARVSLTGWDIGSYANRWDLIETHLK